MVSSLCPVYGVQLGSSFIGLFLIRLIKKWVRKHIYWKDDSPNRAHREIEMSTALAMMPAGQLNADNY